MAKHERTNEKQKDQEAESRPKRRQPPQSERFKAPDEGFADSLAHPSLERHATLLANASSDRERAGLAIQMQKLYGNAYVQRLLNSKAVQAKLTVSQPDDEFEKEADRVADAVMQKSASQIQRQEETEEEEVQPKLASQIQFQEEEEEELQPKLASQIQRQPVEEEEEEEEAVQTKAAEAQHTTSDDLETQINNARGSGQPLNDSVRATLEPQFGYDFGDVKVHTDTEANRLSRQLGAEAFTTGKDIFFRDGTYKPDTDNGKGLIAHELTHVIQQGGKTKGGNTLEQKATQDTTGYDTLQREPDGKQPRLEFTVFGIFEVYPDDFVGPITKGFIERNKQPWPIKDKEFTQLQLIMAPIAAGITKIKITGDANFKATVWSDFGWLMTQGIGKQLILEIIESGKTLTIQEAGSNSEQAEKWKDGFQKPDGKPGPGTNATVNYNPTKKVIGAGDEDWMKRPPAIGLVHELIHAWADMKGITDRTKADPPGYEQQAVGLGEFQDAVLSENAFRGAFGLPLRPRY